MKHYKSIFSSVFLISALLFSVSAQAKLPAEADKQKLPSLAPMLNIIKPSIVNIVAVSKKDGSNQPFDNADDENSQNTAPSHGSEHGKNRGVESMGSGVVVDAKNGYILTNSHLITQAQTMTVTLNDGRHFKAKLVGSDPASDVAVLQVNAERLQAIAVGDSSKLEVGDFVVAIGNPYGLNQTVTSGIVSGLGRTDLGIEGYEDFIQTDASINPGNSGGALVNLRGELVGINTAILAPHGGNIGIGFAIPTNMAKGIMLQLIEHGKLGRGVVGIMIQNLTPEIAKAIHEVGAKGAIVTSVSPRSPAAKIGIKTGDIIQKINSKNITTAGQVRNSIGLMRAGSTFTIQVLRANKPLHFTLKSEDPEVYKQQLSSDNPFLAGMILKNFDAQIPGFDHVQGVQAMQISENSLAWQSGLRQGDVIVTIDGKLSKDLGTAKSLAKQEKDQLLLNIFRSGGAMFVVLQR